MSIQTALFINETDLPVEVSGLIQVMVGLNKLDSIVVMPNEESTIRSITGEWFLSIPYNDSKYRVMWAEKKMNNTMYSLGKFRNSPCMRGDYVWMDTDTFTVKFKENVFRFCYDK